MEEGPKFKTVETSRLKGLTSILASSAKNKKDPSKLVEQKVGEKELGSAGR